jgi:hypothetical protein
VKTKKLVSDMTATIGKGIRAGKYGGWNFSTEENFKTLGRKLRNE